MCLPPNARDFAGLNALINRHRNIIVQKEADTPYCVLLD